MPAPKPKPPTLKPTAAALENYRAGRYNFPLRMLRRALDRARISHNLPAKLPREK